jgi:uncharacterized protein (TIGR02611 family)
VTERHDEANPGAPDAEQPGGVHEPPKLVQRLRHRRERHRDRGRIYRIAWVAAGFIVVVAGLVMVVFPGPALVVIPIGLAMLSLEFAWAERLLDSTLERGVEAKDMAMGASRRQKIVGIAAIVCALAAAGALGLLYLT